MGAMLPLTQRIPTVIRVLERTYPDAQCALEHTNPLELMVATILSAQCTDKLVNKVTPALFKKYHTAKDYAKALLSQLEQDIHSVNFYRNKAKAIKLACQTLVNQFGGKVPDRMEDLLQLHGVARKTANVILGVAFGKAEGIVVDTHVMRLSQRLGWTKQTTPVKIEQELMQFVPKSQWIALAHLLIAHGRAVCKAPTPLCHACSIGQSLCPSYRG